MHNEALQEPQAPRRVIPMWADLLDDMVNYARELGWENHYGEQTWATERTPESGMQRPPERRARTFKQNPPGRKEKSKPPAHLREQRNELWRTAGALGILRAGRPNAVTADLVKAILRCSEKPPQEKHIPNPFETQKENNL